VTKPLFGFVEHRLLARLSMNSHWIYLAWMLVYWA